MTQPSDIDFNFIKMIILLILIALLLSRCTNGGQAPIISQPAQQEHFGENRDFVEVSFSSAMVQGDPQEIRIQVAGSGQIEQPYFRNAQVELTHSMDGEPSDDSGFSRIISGKLVIHTEQNAVWEGTYVGHQFEREGFVTTTLEGSFYETPGEQDWIPQTFRIHLTNVGSERGYVLKFSGQG